MEFENDIAIRDFLDNLPVGQVFTDDVGLTYTVVEPGKFEAPSFVEFTSHAFDANDKIELVLTP